MTQIVNPFSLPLIFHGFSCLSVCFPAQSADWGHLLRLRRSPGHGHSWPLAQAPVSLQSLIHVFFLRSHFSQSAVSKVVCVGVCVCVCVFWCCYAIFKDGILQTLFEFIFSCNQLVSRLWPHHTGQTKKHPDKWTISAVSSMQGQTLSQTIDKHKHLTELIIVWSDRSSSFCHVRQHFIIS